MDEKPDESSPSRNPEQNRTETTSPGGTKDAPPSREASGERVWTYVTQAHYDPDNERDLTTVVVSAIAEAEEVPITEIKSPPLYEVVDIASIDDALFERPDTSKNDTESIVEFRYNQYKVSVEANGWVTVSARGE